MIRVKKQSINVVDAVGKIYYGKTVYVRIPKDRKDKTEVEIELIIRNKNIIYKLF